MNKVIVVESSVKSNLISKYVGEGYDVLASVGHIKDLSISGPEGFGVDIDNGFKASYRTISGKTKVINGIKSKLKNADELILATDPDREGEAISWHLKEEMKFEGKVSRITFNEVTKEKVLEALDNRREIDMDLVNAQESRRIIDRILGFKLSKYTKKTLGAPSAGRVQSVALKVISEKELVINDFKPETWFEAEILIQGETLPVLQNGKVVKFNSEIDANNFIAKLPQKLAYIETTKKKKVTKKPRPLDMVGAIRKIQSKHGYSSNSITQSLQKLFNMGHISYPRTDSNRLSTEFLAKLKSHFSAKNFGKFEAPTASKGSQDAHESIRPTSLSFNFETSKLDPKLKNVYRVILNETLKSASTNSTMEITNHIYKSGDISIKLVDSKITDLGYKQFDEKHEPKFNSIPKDIDTKDVKAKDKQTLPPKRYSSASLIKHLKEIGVGRPSTYGATVKRLVDAGYVESNKNSLSATKTGLELNKALQDDFPQFIKEEYTANMEMTLDKISSGDDNKLSFLDGFYKDFIKHYEKVLSVEKITYSDVKCPQCSSKMIKKFGKYGAYIECSVETCKHRISAKSLNKPPRIVMGSCDKCGSDMIVRQQRSRNKSYFLGCSAFPKCKNLTNLSESQQKELKDKIKAQ